jgi:hypothetical protein
MITINEGGNVFKAPTGESLTQRINREDVPATIGWVESKTNISFPEESWLGTTGKQERSWT